MGCGYPPGSRGWLARNDRPPRHSHEPKEDERITVAAIYARKITDPTTSAP